MIWTLRIRLFMLESKSVIWTLRIRLFMLESESGFRNPDSCTREPQILRIRLFGFGTSESGFSKLVNTYVLKILHAVGCVITHMHIISKERHTHDTRTRACSKQGHN